MSWLKCTIEFLPFRPSGMSYRVTLPSARGTSYKLFCGRGYLDVDDIVESTENSWKKTGYLNVSVEIRGEEVSLVILPVKTEDGQTHVEVPTRKLGRTAPKPLTRITLTKE